ncbi:MAG TPA: aldo/keto reductase, partial [Verrucomicrobiae bacterium]|nr:aldo/keto reductase [Verrucomicrobiae bacterium]
LSVAIEDLAKSIEGNMQYRTIGKTGVRVSEIGFGCGNNAVLMVKAPYDEQVKAVRHALDLGINFFDTAPYYGSTVSETVLGKALKGLPRERYYLSTKIGRYGLADFDFSPERVVRSVDESLSRLKLSHIDLIHCHDIEFTSINKVVDETIPALQRLKRQGKVRKVSVSGLPLRIFPKVLDQTPLDAVLSYCHYCLNDITLVRLFPYLQGKGVGVINAAPLAMGLLSEKGPQKWHPAATEIKEACARAVAYCKKKKASISKLALQFAIGHRDIASTFVGLPTPAEVRQSVRCVEERIDMGLLAEVQEILRPIQNQTWPSGLPENN